MIGIQTQHLIEQQIPGHIRESNPLFTKFLQYYYEFQKQAKIPDIIQEVKKYNDIDEVDEAFLLDFFEEFKKLPHSTVADKRLVAKHVYDLYKSKGSEDGLRLLFRIVYGEEIDVYYPNNDILRASDGRWIQDNVITAKTVSGAITSTSNRIVFTSTQGLFEFEIKSTETLTSDTVRFFFEPRKPYYVDADQEIRVYSNNTLDFVGELVPMPSFIEVDDGGAYWQLGQIVVLPAPAGSKDTICQVKRIGTDGSIKRLDIIEYGYGLEADTTYTISPFLFKPTSSYTEAYTERISEFPPAYNHNLSIFDINEDVIESVTGYDSDQDYVLTGYVISEYITRLAFSQNTTTSTSSDVINPDITIEQWIASRARVKIRNAYSAKASGYYEDLRGQPSAQSIRLQDNFFYQLFSYVIDTSRMLSEYKSILSVVHPAGMKYFSNTVKEVSISTSISTSRILSRDSVLLSDTYSTEDQMSFGNTINVYDNIVASTRNVNDNYDANNELSLYDPEVDWDEIKAYAGVYDLAEYDNGDYNVMDVAGDTTTVYDANEYDLSEYNQTPQTYVDQYTLEDDSIDITKS